MKHSVPAFAALCLLSLSIGCRPRPLDIEVPQKPAALSVSSAMTDEHTLYVSAAYSVNSLLNLTDPADPGKPATIPSNMMVDSGLVTITAEGGLPDTLRKAAAGLFLRDDLQLQPGGKYTLMVHDYRKGTAAAATTTYQPTPTVQTLQPTVQRTAADTTVRLLVTLNGVAAADHYYVSYATTRQMREAAMPLQLRLASLPAFTPKRLELMSGEEASEGRIARSIALQVKATDTVVVQAGRIDEAYFRYLSIYKRSGTLISQLTGEPVNLPGNILPGYGFFTLHVAERRIFRLADY